MIAKNSTHAIQSCMEHISSLRAERSTLENQRLILGMPSRGYLADVLSGRRILATKYQDQMFHFLGLRPIEAEVLALMLQHDRCKTSSTKKAVAGTLKRFRKLLQAADDTHAIGEEGLSFFSCIVLAAMSLIGENVNRRQLECFFGDDKNKALDKAFAELSEKGLIKTDQGTLKFQEGIIYLQGMTAHRDKLRFLKQSILDGFDKSELWFDQQDDSCFQSFILTADYSAYREAMRQIKIFAYDQMMKIEKPSGNSIVQFNVQIYPHVRTTAT